jgi:hypothetical protein
MRLRPALGLGNRGSAIVLAALLAGCLGLGGPAPSSPHEGTLSIRVSPGLLRIVYSLPEPTTPGESQNEPPPGTVVSFAIYRASDRLAFGNMTRAGPLEWTAAAVVPVGSGTYSVQVFTDGALENARSVGFASEPWAPAGAGSWPFRLTRTIGHGALAWVSGTLTGAPDGTWNLTTAGAIADVGGNGSVVGPITAFTLAHRGTDITAEHFHAVLNLSDANGTPLGVWTVDRRFVAQDRVGDAQGIAHDAYFFAVWSHTVGARTGVAGTKPVDATDLTYQWLDQTTGQGILWKRFSWDNASAPRETTANGYGFADVEPGFVLDRGFVPRPALAGDAFNTTGPTGAGTIAYASGPAGSAGTGFGANSIPWRATLSGNLTGAAELVLDPQGGLIGFNETATAGLLTQSLQVGRAPVLPSANH